MSSAAASLDIAKNLTITQTIDSHNKTITIRAPPIDLNPKNTIDQRQLSVNCKRNMKSAALAHSLLSPFCHTRNADIPIIVNRVIQTGPNIQSGGLKDGFLIKAYHSGMDRAVKKPPMIPAKWQTKILSNNFNALIINRYVPIWGPSISPFPT